jgi:hypothetical protein
VLYTAARSHLRTVLMINTYSMADVRDRVLAEEFPGQHLWGCRRLPYGWQLRVFRPTFGALLRRLRIPHILLGKIQGLIGDPFQQAWALCHSFSADVIWSPTQAAPALLGALRRLRILRTPLVVLLHSDARAAWTRWWLTGADHIVVFSPGVKQRLIDRGVEGRSMSILPWGPQPDSPLYARYRDAEIVFDFVSIGKDNRDHNILHEAALLGKLSGVIADGRDTYWYVDGIRRADNSGQISYAHAIELLSAAKCCVVPILDTRRMTGLTELNDAIALGRPIAMTRNNLMPFDIEDAAVGCWLDPRITAERLAEVIRTLPKSRRVQDSVAKWFNEDQFSHGLWAIFDGLRGRRDNVN